MTAAKPPPLLAKNLTRDEKRKVLQSVPCTFCQALAGRSCRRPSGTPGGALIHAARYALVSEKGLIRW